MRTDNLTAAEGPLAREDLELLDAYWRAANCLSVGQIYLLDKPLLREPLRLEHIKRRPSARRGRAGGHRWIRRLLRH